MSVRIFDCLSSFLLLLFPLLLKYLFHWSSKVKYAITCTTLPESNPPHLPPPNPPPPSQKKQEKKAASTLISSFFSLVLCCCLGFFGGLNQAVDRTSRPQMPTRSDTISQRLTAGEKAYALRCHSLLSRKVHGRRCPSGPREHLVPSFPRFGCVA